MGKLDEMLRGAGANVGESMGEGRSTGAVHRTPPVPFAGVPARLQGVVKAKDAAEIPVGKIEADGGQPREEFDDASLARLAASLKTRGQLQPIRVRWDEDRGVYVIVAGERRWRAAALAGLKTMTCVIHDGPLAPAELLSVQLVENMLREDLKPVEQAKAFRSLMGLNGWTVRELARELAIDHSGVVRSLAILELPAAVQARVEQGTLAPATAYELSKVDDPAEQAELADRVVSEGMSRAETAEAVRDRRAGKSKGRGRKVTSRVFRTAAGRVTVELRKGSGAEAIAEALEDAARQARATSSSAGGQAAA